MFFKDNNVYVRKMYNIRVEVSDNKDDDLIYMFWFKLSWVIL